MFTLQLSNIVHRAILKKKKKIAFLLLQKGVLGTKLAIKTIFSSNLFSFLFFSNGMTNMSPNIFISNDLLKNPTERNA